MTEGIPSRRSLHLWKWILLFGLLSLLSPSRSIDGSASIFADALPQTPIANNSVLKLCYIYFGPYTDLGWTFTYNVARLDSQKILSDVLSSFNISVDSRTHHPSTFFLYPNKTAHTISLIQQSCRIILTNNDLLLGDDNKIANLYPNVSFVLLHHARLGDTSLPNVAYVGFNKRPCYYLKGYASGLVAKRKACFMAAWEDASLGRNANDAANGFMLGIRAANATLPIEIINMNSWYWPDAEVEVANLFLQRGCDVIGRYSDGFFVDNVVATATDATLASLSGPMSVGPHSNLQLYVGDSVLVASYLDWSRLIVPIIEDIVATGKPNQTKAPFYYGTQSGVVVTTSLSPRAPLKISEAYEAKKAALLVASSEEPLCGFQILRSGTPLRYQQGKNCLSATDNIPEFIDVGNVLFHPDFKYIDQCPPGTFGRYRSENITLECVICPKNTYTSTNASRMCTPCPDGTETDVAGSTGCNPKASPVTLGTILAIILPAGFIIFALLIGFIRVRQSTVIANAKAPRQAPFYLVFTDVENSVSLWKKYPKAMSKAMTTHHRLVREAIDDNSAYEVKTIGDNFMIATTNGVDAALLACQIQSSLQSAKWPVEIRKSSSPNDFEMEDAPLPSRRSVQLGANPLLPVSPADIGAGSPDRLNESGSGVDGGLNQEASFHWNGLRVKVGIHYCTDVTVRFEKVHEYYDYTGPDVNLAIRVGSQARGGEILMTATTLDRIRADPDFTALVAREAELRLIGSNFPLEGTNEKSTATLYSLVPVVLAWRVFPSLKQKPRTFTGPGFLHYPSTAEDPAQAAIVHVIPPSATPGTSGASNTGAEDEAPQSSAANVEFALDGSRVGTSASATGIDRSFSEYSSSDAGESESVAQQRQADAHLLKAILNPLPPSEQEKVLQRLLAVHSLRPGGASPGSGGQPRGLVAGEDVVMHLVRRARQVPNS